MRASYADLIRDHAVSTYVEPARRRGDATVRIVAGDVQRALKLTNRTPAVCQALGSRIFLEENSLELERKEGPPSGQSTTVVFTYRLTHEANRKPAMSGLRSLRGSGKAAFAKLGGGESFIRESRENFYSDWRDKP